MLKTVADKQSNGRPAPVKLAHYDDWVLVTFQVLGPNTLFFDDSSAALTNSSSGVQGGFQLVTGDGIKQFFWKGELWVMGSAPNTVFNFKD